MLNAEAAILIIFGGIGTLWARTVWAAGIGESKPWMIGFATAFVCGVGLAILSLIC